MGIRVLGILGDLVFLLLLLLLLLFLVVGVIGEERDWSCMVKITCLRGLVFLSHKSDQLGGRFLGLGFSGFSGANDIVFSDLKLKDFF